GQAVPAPPEARAGTSRRLGPNAAFRITLLALIASGWAAIYVLPWEPIFRVRSCLFLRLTAHPCPFCGMTRACVAFGHGDIEGALAHHPLAPFLMAASVAVFAVTAFRLAAKKPLADVEGFLSRRRWLTVLGAGVVLGAWILKLAKIG
ncbi:DUF2752 domain-containing protein, partial [bacterium]|nr:DUF2752 domain-containing protein [bacterium]